MTVGSSSLPQHSAVHAMIAADGRLVTAEPRLADLNRRAGGDVGRPLALAALAAVVRLSRRLGIAVARSVTIADEDRDVELWVRAEPAGDSIRVTVTDWRERPVAPPSRSADEAAAFLVAGAEWEWRCDGAMRLTWLAAEAGRQHGFDAVALLGEPVTGLFDLAAGASVIEALAEQRPFADVAATVRASGRPVLLSAIVRREPGGGFSGFIGSVRAREARAEPASAPPAAAAFAAGLDRVLRRPLAQIVANADSIHAGTDGPVGPDYLGYAADIAQAGRHLLGMIDDLVDLQAVERPDFAPAADRIDLADVAGRAAGLLAVRAAQAGVAIERPLTDTRFWAAADFRRVLQILVNLIGNAMRYAPRGSIVLLRLSRAEGRVAIAIADEGKGIAPADQGRVFEKFERVDASEPGGSGLGLYISRRLARAMGGDLTLASVPGEGATFTLTLPASIADDPG